MNDSPNLPEVSQQLETKLLTLTDILKLLSSSSDSATLPDTVRRFKLSMVKKSLNDVIRMTEASDKVQEALMKKIDEDIVIYPITTLLDIMNNINKIVDRNLAIVESIIPKEDMANYLANARTVNFINAPINMEGRSPAALEKIALIAEAAIAQMNRVPDAE